MNIEELVQKWDKNYRIYQYKDNCKVYFQKDWSREMIEGEWRMKITKEDAEKVIKEKNLVGANTTLFTHGMVWGI
jgi:hypothetical protein